LSKVYFPDQRIVTPVIQIEHQRIHQGEMYVFSYDAYGIGTASQYIYIDPNGKSMHFTSLTAALESGSITLELYENPTMVSNVATVVAVNANRFSSKTSDTFLFSDNEISDNGTRLFSTGVYGAVGGGKAGVVSDTSAFEIILNNTNTYLLRANVQSSAGDIVMNGWFYEPEGGI